MTQIPNIKQTLHDMILIWFSPVYILKIIYPVCSFTLFPHALGLPSDCFPRNFSTKLSFALN